MARDFDKLLDALPAFAAEFKSRLAALSAREADVAERQKAIDKRERACKSLEKELKQRQTTMEGKSPDGSEADHDAKKYEKQLEKIEKTIETMKSLRDELHAAIEEAKRVQAMDTLLSPPTDAAKGAGPRQQNGRDRPQSWPNKPTYNSAHYPWMNTRLSGYEQYHPHPVHHFPEGRRSYHADQHRGRWMGGGSDSSFPFKPPPPHQRHPDTTQRKRRKRREYEDRHDGGRHRRRWFDREGARGHEDAYALDRDGDERGGRNDHDREEQTERKTPPSLSNDAAKGDSVDPRALNASPSPSLGVEEELTLKGPVRPVRGQRPPVPGGEEGKPEEDGADATTEATGGIVLEPLPAKKGPTWGRAVCL